MNQRPTNLSINDQRPTNPRSADIDITVAEALALASAVSLHDPERPLAIYTDSQVNLDRLAHFEKHGRLPRTTPLRAIEPLQTVISVIRARKQQGKRTDLKHVLSHTLDRELPQEKREQRKERMHQRYGSDALRIQKGNQRADTLAKSGTHKQAQRNLAPHSTALPRFLLVDKNGDPIDNAHKKLHEEYAHLLRKEMLDDTRPPIKRGEPARRPYEWLQDEDVHWPYSTLLGKDVSKNTNKLIRFMIRARRGLFADKQTRLARQDSDYWLHRYGGIRVDNDQCDRCGETETRFHFCECKAAEGVRAGVTTQIIKLINSYLQPEHHISDVPRFWASEQRHERHPSALWQKIESRKIEFSAMGIIPDSFVEFLESLHWQPQTNVRKIAAQVQILIVQGHFDAWTERCKTFGEKHTRRAQVERRVRKVQERENRRQEKQRRRQQKRRTRAADIIDLNARHRPPKRIRTTKRRPPPHEEPPP